MRYQIVNQDANLALLQRLFQVRNLSDDPHIFLSPSLATYWLDPFLLNDMQKAVERIIQAMKQQEKIMIFGDYDVDGITASYVVFKAVTTFLHYPNISIMYPNRLEDGYGLKNKHLDLMKSKGVSLVITVDNGITSVQEAEYAKSLGIDVIITDHHHALEILPEAYALVNPQVSEHYPFKGLAGVGVAFKLIMALLSQSTLSKEEKNQIFNYFLPIVAIGTIADVVPLVHENRVIVKKGLERINHYPEQLPKSLQGFLNFLNIKGGVDTFHVGFVIGPRINAGGRIESPYDSLKVLLMEGDKQLTYLEKIEAINTERRRMQDQAFRLAEKKVNSDQYFLSVCDESFHEGIVGIVAGRITEKYRKPSAIFKIDHEKQQAVASLRGPEYFNVIEMITKASPYLMRFGGHKGAGGLTVALEYLEKVITIFQEHCHEIITPEQLERVVTVDTILLHHEWNPEELATIEQLAPFGEGNPEPLFLLEAIQVEKVEKVGKNGGAHLKIHGKFGDQVIPILFWNKGSEAEIVAGKINVIGRVKRDTFNGGFYLHGEELLTNQDQRIV